MKEHPRQVQIDQITEALGLPRVTPVDFDAPHPFKGKTVEDLKPIGSWWHKGWIIYFTDGTSFRTHGPTPKGWVDER